MPANPLEWNAAHGAAFLLVLMRMAGLFFTSPFFASRNIPALHKAAWTLLAAFVLFPVVPYRPEAVPTDAVPFALAVVRELFVGFTLGLAAFLVFVGIQLAGAVIDIQMGLGVMNLIDPLTQTQVSVMGQFYFLVATLVFLAVDGHHLLLRALAESFRLIDLGGASFTGALAGKMMDLTAGLFFTAFRVGAPVIGALFLTNLGLGILARTVPQMNVFIVGLPLTVGVGYLMVMLCMGFFAFVLQGLFRGMYRDLAVLIQLMR